MDPIATTTSSEVPASPLDRVMRCSACGASEWRSDAQSVVCSKCGQRWELRNGVLSATTAYADASTRYYDETGGPRFVGTAFGDNVQVFAATRAYLRMLEEWYPKPSGAFLDLGAGDGRVTLWALEKGFHPVVAVDASLPALQRLAVVAQKKDLSGLVAIASPIQTAPIRTAAFSAIACIEVLYYLTAVEHRGGALKKIADLLAPGGTLMLSEFTRLGRALADVVAMNVENLKRTAFQGTRQEKTVHGAVEISHPTPAELARDIRSSGLRVLDLRAISPIPMLFQHAYTFTSYPLRPALDEEMQTLIAALDDQAAEPCALARNLVYLLSNDAARG